MIIGIAGADGSGKTSLALELARRLGGRVVNCYRRYDPALPDMPEPAGRTQALNAVAQYLRVEDLRFEDAREPMASNRDVVLDCTIDMVLARAHALGRLRGFDCDEEARRMVLDSRCLIPDLTLQLLAPPNVRRLRLAGQNAVSESFDDTVLTGRYRGCSRRPLSPVSLRLVATASVHELADAVGQYLRHRRWRGDVSLVRRSRPRTAIRRPVNPVNRQTDR